MGILSFFTGGRLEAVAGAYLEIEASYGSAPEFIEKMLKNADQKYVVCIDEREIKPDSEDGKKLLGKNPVNLPGGIYCLIDALKVLRGLTEEEAWEVYLDSGLPVGAHPHCGYAELAENNYQTLGLNENADSETRLEIIRNTEGSVVPEYEGSHNIQYALLNFRSGDSVDQDQRSAKGVMSCDLWYVWEKAHKLGLDREEATRFVANAFTAAVSVLTQGRITTFYVTQ